jgi:hypothetical protein
MLILLWYKNIFLINIIGMKYTCIQCNYTTDDDSGNLSRHNKSKGHLKRVNKQTLNDVFCENSEESNVQNFICPHCDAQTINL